MCGGVFYLHKGEENRFYFPNPSSVLPVKNKDGETSLIAWGRREKQQGITPLGGWARLESIYAGLWQKYSPVPVKILVSQFMEKDIEGTSHWFDITKGKFIQGLLVEDKLSHSLRIYVVTIEPEQEQAVHNRWPRILS